MHNYSKILLVSVALFIAAFPANAQSAGEISAAKSLARSYGYTELEINNILNGRRSKSSSKNALTESQTVPVSETSADAEFAVPVEEGLIQVLPVIDAQLPDYDIYGQDVFTSKGMSVIPSYNAPVPENYVLGPGDEVVIDVWGSANAHLVKTISKDGTIRVSDIGPVSLAGITVKEAESLLKSRLSRIYGGLSGGGSSLKLTIGHIKGVTVTVVGEVVTPGAYTLPSLSSITSALFMANGLTKEGSVREITLYRGGNTVARFDLYDMIFNGNYDANLRLQDGDVISVSSYRDVVRISGEVKREMKYELVDGETLADLLRYSGGFTSVAAAESVTVTRKTGGVRFNYNVSNDRFDTFAMEYGDIVKVNKVKRWYSNRVIIDGEVAFPGHYAIDENVATLSDLLKVAGGLRDGAYVEDGIIYRVDENELPVSVSFNVKKVADGQIDIPLEREDSVFIFKASDLVQKTDVYVYGEVNFAGPIEFRKGMSLADAIALSGGTKEGVDLTNVEIASRGEMERGTVNLYNIDKGGEDPETIMLKPWDNVYLRAKAFYRPVSSVVVKGEVNYPGTYAVAKDVIRLSDIISRAQGFTDVAYVRGASLVRKITDEERARFDVAFDVAERNMEKEETDNTKKNANEEEEEKPLLILEETYSIGIDLQAAVNNPGGYADVVLRDGDVINVPQMNNTVKVSGAVFYPNTVAFNPHYSWRDYVNQAGGFAKNARRKGTYAVYTNGMVATRGSGTFKMEPGMEIVIPEKPEDNGPRMTVGEIAAIASSASSLAYIVVALINMLGKK